MDTAATINLSDILGGDHFYPGDGLPELAVFPVRLPFEDYPRLPFLLSSCLAPSRSMDTLDLGISGPVVDVLGGRSVASAPDLVPQVAASGWLV